MSAFCSDCPDHEACSTGWPCWKVKELRDNREVGLMTVSERGIGTYPVGLLADLKHHKVKQGLGYVVGWVKEGNWRAVRNYFNGYLAEWHYPPEDMIMHCCGRGWTRQTARRRLGKHILNDNLSEQERLRIKMKI